MFKTRITELLGIEHPIIQGGMQWVSRAELIAAISNAGGLGILSALSFMTPEALADEIKKTRSLTDKPFGVNLTLLPIFREVSYEAYIDAIAGEGVKIVETAGRITEDYMKRFKSAGIKVIHKCTAVRFALTAERMGCDVISIDGFECAGSPGEEDITSMVLVPAAVDALKVPVVASGGFADGRGLVAALALGAEAVNMGTRFVVTKEAPVHPKVKEWLVNSSERDTVLLMRSFRNTTRRIKNAVALNALEMEKKGATLEELAPLIAGQKGKELQETGDIERGTFTAGQVIGLIRDIPTVKELIDRIIGQARDIVTNRLNKLAIN